MIVTMFQGLGRTCAIFFLTLIFSLPLGMIIALLRMSKSCAFLSGRDYVVPQDVQLVFENVCSHRVFLSPRARVSGLTEQQLLKRALAQVSAPSVV